jgi:hypothetical protein
MVEIKDQLSKVSGPEFRAISKVFQTHASMNDKLDQFDAYLVASANSPGILQHQFVHPSLLRTNPTRRACLQAIEKLVQEEGERRLAE